MARYNTSFAKGIILESTVISSPYTGAFTELTGLTPYVVVIPNPVLFPGSNQTFYNSSSVAITIQTPAGLFKGTGGTNTTTVVIPPSNVVSVTSTGTDYIVISEDGSPLVATTGLFSSDVTINGSTATANISPSVLTINPSSNTSSMNNVKIGENTKQSGGFTSLTATGQVTLSGNIASTTTGTGTAVITGGLGVSGNINSGGTVTATALSGPLTGTLQTAAQPNVTSLGTLTGLTTSGTITSTTNSPLALQSNGNTGTFTQTVIYSNQNNTSANTLNGIFIERGRLTDSASAEIRNFVIGSRGGQIQFLVDGSGNVGINSNSADYKLTVVPTSGVYNASVANAADIGGGVVIRGNNNGANSRVGLFFQGSDKIGTAIASAREDPGTTWKTYLAFYTNNVTGVNVQDLQEKMRISSAGIITKPYQPAFDAVPPAGYALTGGDQTISGTWSEQSDRSNNFNPSNGTFTAPVAGFYHFTWSSFVTSTSTRNDAYISVNGSQRARSEISGYAAGTSNRSSMISLSTYLSANDAVTVGIYISGTGNTYGTQVPWGRFSGFLVG